MESNVKYVDENNVVSLFHSIGNETVKQNLVQCNNNGNKNETRNIRELANRVLRGLKIETAIETNSETNIKNGETKCIANDPYNETSQRYDLESINNLKQESLYLFYERLGISNNPDLAINETLDYIFNNLTDKQ